MELLKLIKNRQTVRKYKDIPIDRNIIEKIIEAGKWASSVHGFQPWRFFVITDASLIKQISDAMNIKAMEIKSNAKKLLSLTAKTISNTKVLIAIYNQNSFKDVTHKFFKIKGIEITDDEAMSGVRISEISEIEAISGAIQNMILVADSFNIGSCWNTVPLYCEKEINQLLGNDEQLIAFLTMGYPAEKQRRSRRKADEIIVQYIL